MLREVLNDGNIVHSKSLNQIWPGLFRLFYFVPSITTVPHRDTILNGMEMISFLISKWSW